ncbi:hypothetical protein CJU90_5890 [Yarrowia sp. C11]|nr:hypothetical protein CJU90_5890 [Yarrowia sp. C11]KAG5364460.1 hypothetical protein CKK34_3268 [Yarrowia sp. E02]
MTPRLPLPIQAQSINLPPPQSPQVKREDLIDASDHSREDLTSLKRRRLETVGSHSPVPRPSSAHTQTQLSPNGQQPPSPYYPYSHTHNSTHPLQHPSAQLHQPPPPPPQQQQAPLPPHHDYHYTHGPPISPIMGQAPPTVQTPTQTPSGLHQPHGGIQGGPPPPPPPQTLIYPHQQYFSPYGVGDMRYPTPPQPMAHSHGPTGPMPPMGPPHSHLQHHHIPPPPPHLMGHQMQLGVAVHGPSFALRRPIPARQRTSIACRYCRRRKIRCSGFDPENPDSRCSNCIRFNQECVFIPVSSMASTDKKGGGADGAVEGVGAGGYDRLSPTLSDSDKREWKPQPHPTSPTEIRNAISPAISPSPPTAATAPVAAASSTSTSPTSASSSTLPTPPTRSKLSIQNLLG